MILADPANDVSQGLDQGPSGMLRGVNQIFRIRHNPYMAGEKDEVAPLERRPGRQVTSQHGHLHVAVAWRCDADRRQAALDQA